MASIIATMLAMEHLLWHLGGARKGKLFDRSKHGNEQLNEGKNETVTLAGIKER
jgi:hypothetical protein